MNGKKYGKLLVLAVVVGALAMSIACGTASDAAEKAMYNATPTCEQRWGNAVVLDEYTEFFYVKDGNRVERVSPAGLTNLIDQPNGPVACHIVRERVGASYDLVDCYPTDAYGVIVGEEGLLLSK